MRRLVLLIVLTIAACQPTATPSPTQTTSAPTAITTVEVTAEVTVPVDNGPPLVDVTSDVSVPMTFDDMAAGAVEVTLSGDLASGSTATAGPIEMLVTSDASRVRQAVIALPVRSASGATGSGTLILTFYVPADINGAQTVIGDSALAAAASAVRLDAGLSGLAPTVFDLGTTYAVQGDIRILDNATAFTAAFDVTVTSGTDGKAFRIVGRANALPIVVS